MKYSVELPINYLDKSDQLDYHFIIASHCLEHPEYYEFYKNRNKSKFTILDNGAFETGEAIEDSDYLEIIKILSPDVVVIPDVYKNPKATLARYTEFMQTWKEAKIEDIALMGVIQCDGREDIAHMMGDLYYSTGVEWIGVPYISELNRARFIALHPEWLNIHILGLHELSDIIGYNSLPNIKSIDSSLPIKVTKENKLLSTQTCSYNILSITENELDESLLDTNLRIFKAFCNSTEGLKGLGI